MKASIRVSIVLAVTLLISSGFTAWRTQQILEQVLLDRTKYEVTMFLLGIERKARAAGGVLDPNSLQIAMSDTLRDSEEGLSFTIKQFYAYNRKGDVYAWIGDKEKQRPMDGHYGEVLRQDKPYFGDEIEKTTNRINGLTEYFTDIIIPLHQDGKAVGGLEAEIDLGETMKQIKFIYAKYEGDLAIVSLSLLALSLLLVWLALRRQE